MAGKVNVDSGSDEAQSLLLEPWPPLEKALVVEKGMNRESDEREILDLVLVLVSAQKTCETPCAFAEP